MAIKDLTINVDINGVEKAQKQIGGIDQKVEKLGVGGEQVGSAFSNASGIISSMGGSANESLGALTGSLGGVVDSMSNMGNVAKSSGLSIGAMLGPIGLVALAVFEAIKAFKEWSDEVDGSTMKLEAYTAAAGEAKSMIEGLADAGVQLRKEDIKLIREQTLEAQKSLEMGQKLAEKTAKTQLNLEKARKRIIQLRKEVDYDKSIKNFDADLKGFGASSEARLKKAIEEETRLNKSLKALYNDADKAYIEGSRVRTKNAQMRIEFERQTTEAIKARLDLQFDLEQRINLLIADRVGMNLDQVKLSQEVTSSLKVLSEQYESREITEEQFLRASKEINLKHARDLEKLDKESNKKKLDERKANNQKYESLRKQRLIEESLLRKLEIKLTKVGFDQEKALLGETYDLRVKLSKEASNQRKIALKQYELDTKNLNQKIQSEYLANFEGISEKIIGFAQYVDTEYSHLESLQIQRLELSEQTMNTELELLKAKFDQEKRLVKENSIELLRITEKYDHDVSKIRERTMLSLDTFQPYLDGFTSGMAQATASSLLFGDSFKDGVANVLKSLAMQAGVQSLMQLAEGTAKFFTFPTLAGKHFKASAIFAGASIMAKAGSSALGGGVGSSGTSGSTASNQGGSRGGGPPLREQAKKEETTVYNINFSGTVYDTKKASKIAFSNELSRLQNPRNRRRGAYAL